ncbi:MAG: hypothetical protein KC736_01450 [Candidatus Moranbacteria bacterium]|nr:hypothetical protein [Candidatus Moranbacteria bacterium]
MDKRSKIILFPFLGLSVLLILFSYYRFVVVYDFPFSLRVPCDPSVEMCFATACSVDLGDCQGMIEEPTVFYKNVTFLANTVSSCSELGECPVFLDCIDPLVSSSVCEVQYCDEESALEEEAECVGYEEELFGENFNHL